MGRMEKEQYIIDLSKTQWAGLIILRMLIGWHLLYEGLIKIYDPDWTSVVYLKQSTWIFSGLFHAMADSPGWLSFIDVFNPWALVLIGCALTTGLFSKTAAYSGMILLLLYYLAQPPFFGETQIAATGNDLIVNAVLIEAAGLFILSRFPTGKIIGIDRLFYLKRGSND